MKTRDAVKEKSRILFNQKGVMNVTLRDVAEEVGRSYGNVTYHFKNKEDLVSELYSDMTMRLGEISREIMSSGNLFESILKAPEMTFDLSVHYLFLWKDYVEIMRNFKDLAEEVERNNKARMVFLKQSLLTLQSEKILRADLDSADLDYLMELSGAVRTFFFMRFNDFDSQLDEHKQRYVAYTNNLLVPYLTPQGRKEFKRIFGE